MRAVFFYHTSSMIRSTMKRRTTMYAIALLFLFLSAAAGNGGDFPRAQAEETTEQIKEPVAVSTNNAQEKRAELEAQLAELEHQIAEQQTNIEDNQKKQKTLKNEIGSLNAQISKLNLQIKAVDLSLTNVNQNIIETQRQINRTENKIGEHKDALGKAVRDLYEADTQGLMEIILANDTLSDFFANVNDIALVQNNIRIALSEIVKLRGELVGQKRELALEKEDTENLKNARESQRRSVASTQKEKNTILTVTKGKESEYQKLLKEKQESASQIRSRIFELLGGGELTFEKAYNFARLAEKATGVRAAFILAILNQESALGRNVGQCKYNEIKSQTGKTVMHPDQIPVFLKILEKNNIDPESRAAYVSCPILRDGNYGGAMGPAQFMPSTWKLYENDIAKVTGNNPPNPWSNADAFAATALYLQDSLGSSACRNYGNQIPEQRQALTERCAAAQYYAGNRWYTYRFVYGEPVVTKANKFQKDIDILNA